MITRIYLDHSNKAHVFEAISCDEAAAQNCRLSFVRSYVDVEDNSFEAN
jgi:hypothetical protein